MSLDEIEDLRKAANIVAEKLAGKPSSILKVEFERFYLEIIRAWESAIVEAYKQGQLQRVEANPTNQKEKLE